MPSWRTLFLKLTTPVLGGAALFVVLTFLISAPWIPRNAKGATGVAMLAVGFVTLIVAVVVPFQASSQWQKRDKRNHGRRYMILAWWAFATNLVIGLITVTLAHWINPNLFD
jgi:heme/copper-type cytochrome/quinol oxidase subunit 2